MTGFQRPLVVLSEPIATDAVERLRLSAEVRIASSPAEEVLAEEARDAEALIVRSTRVGATLISACPRLRVIGRHGAGVENIDVAAASRHGVAVVNTPGANAYSVAEFVVLATMALSRRLAPAVSQLREGELSGASSLPGAVVRAGLVGETLRGRTLGIVGMGAIGRTVVELASGLGMRAVGHDPFVTDAPAGIAMLGLSELAGAADVISLHLPATAQTRGLIDGDLLAQMRPGVLLVNTARAEVVDEEALLAALASGRVGGYAVDVYAPEPPATDAVWLNYPHVLATPHMAAMTQDALTRMAEDVVSGVLAVLGDQPDVPVVNKAELMSRTELTSGAELRTGVSE